MFCTEEKRLRTLYDDALRRWAQFGIELGAFTSPQIDEIFQVFIDQKNEARNRLLLHRRNCSRCELSDEFS